MEHRAVGDESAGLPECRVQLGPGRATTKTRRPANSRRAAGMEVTCKTLQSPRKLLRILLAEDARVCELLGRVRAELGEQHVRLVSCGKEMLATEAVSTYTVGAALPVIVMVTNKHELSKQLQQNK